MTNAVVVAGVRTPIGRAHKGSLVDVDAFQLGAVILDEIIARAGVAPDDIDDIVLAESLQGGGVIARHAAVQLGLTNLAGLATNRHCAAGLSAVQIAAGSIIAGMGDVMISGGVESLSSMPRLTKRGEAFMPESHPPTAKAPAFDMSITVGENTARLAGVTRKQADEWAMHSHLRAFRAGDEGRFDDEIVAVRLPDGRLFEHDEQPRPDTTMERLAGLSVLHPELNGAIVTAGNSAGLNDAAAAVMVTSDAYAAARGLAPLARILSWANVGVDPVRTGLAPTLAIPRALDRAGLSIADIDLFEINEAFCSMAVASSRVLGIDHEIVNVNGSGCGLGHPIAATGARMLITTMFELRRRGGGLACVSMCAGGGMGSALVFEVPAA